MAVFVNICCAFFAVFLIYMVLRNWRYYQLIRKIPSPKGRFILGNVYELLKTRNDLKGFVALINQVNSSSVICIWVFHLPSVLLIKHNSAEAILSSSQEIEKSYSYDMLQPWLGFGLLTSTGNRWRSHRKLLTPSFHFRILENFMPIFNEQSEILASLLSSNAGNGIFDLYPFISRCTLDIICETAMGKRMDTQLGQNSGYLNALETAADIFMLRILQPWLRVPWIFELSSLGRRQKRCLDILHGFTENVIAERRKEYEANQGRISREDENDEKNCKNVYGQKIKKAFLDTLLEASYKRDIVLTDKMIRDETSTFMFEGHDTTAVNLSWVLYLLGWCPSVQEVVHRELDRVFGDSNRPVNLDDLAELKYLEAVIKETLRLLPSVPLFGRRISQDVDIGGYTIPRGAEVSIVPGLIGTDPNVYTNPLNFDPTRFLKEDFQKRQPYSYVPFSAGPRNCIGQKFAMMEEKVILANVLRKFEIMAYNDVGSLRAAGDLVYRPVNGLPVSLEKRSFAYEC